MVCRDEPVCRKAFSAWGTLMLRGTSLIPAGGAAEFKGRGVSQLHRSHVGHMASPCALTTQQCHNPVQYYNPITLWASLFHAEAFYLHFVIKRSVTLLMPLTKSLDFYLKPVALLPS